MFKPKFSLNEAEYFFHGNSLNEKELKNTELYRLVKEITEKAHPSLKTRFDTQWEDFYLPLRRSGKIISIPLSILKYRGNFYANFLFLGNLKISRGKQAIEKEYLEMFRDTERFMAFYAQEDFIKKTIPYDFRTGKIKGKYVLEKLMPAKEKARILESYRKHLEKNLETEKISLNDYLNTAAICYKSSFKKARKMSPLEMYKKWADGRHSGMLEIKDSSSREEFSYWQKHHLPGGHPFEIVFSWHEHGIHLYPPYEGEPFYSLRVTNYSYAPVFIQMLKSLIKNKVPFRAEQLNEILDYLTGETYFTVNDYDKLRFTYSPSKEDKRRYFKHIAWDGIKIVKLNSSQVKNEDFHNL
ncbi:hypothetical protein A3K73_05755 [Candidatus Pacearchaeota archaeon RBG_13_36_9]|nr:MAG: hypothetical protein A3K73_05755 [Candidatus Pacearchaeota archaeon RBG_13_36_9]